MFEKACQYISNKNSEKLFETTNDVHPRGTPCFEDHKTFFGQISNFVISSVTTIQTQPIVSQLLTISLYFLKCLKLLSNA